MSSDNKLPIVSVITVVRNDKEHIEATLNSLFMQDYSNIEYIVIDGASTDGTYEVLDRYRDKINILISEPDNGIYDAMNKGILLSNGDYVGFLNSGDEYVNSKVISTIFSKLDKCVDVIYGDSIEISGKGEKYIKAADFSVMEFSPAYRHGSSFTKRDIQKKYMFKVDNRKLGYSLDWESIYSIYKDEHCFYYCKNVIEKYQQEGISSNGYLNAWYNYLITSSYGNKISKLFYYFKNLVAMWIKTRLGRNKYENISK